MGLLFPECFKTTSIASHPASQMKNSRTSSSSSSKTLVDFSSEDEDREYIEKKIYQTPKNQYIVTSFQQWTKDPWYDEDTDTEDDEFSKSETHPQLSPILSVPNYPANKLYTLFCCPKCHNHICISNLIISNNFQGKSGDAFLVSNVINSKLGVPEKKEMMTGVYEVCDVNCGQCGAYLGWKYLRADSRREKYKIGKYVIEKAMFEEVNVLGG